MATFSMAKAHILRLAPETACVLIGQPGIGKTDFVFDLAQTLGLELVKLRCAEAGETGDLTGLLREVNGVHSHTIPDWLSHNKPVLLFLDEINRAKKDTINAIMQLCTKEQEFLGHRLAPGSRVICAMNPSSIASNDVDELNRALYSRMSRIHIDVSKSDWLAWATTHGIHPDIISYIDQATDEHLFKMDDVDLFEDENTVNPRAWENFSKMYTNGIRLGDYKQNPTLIQSDAASHLGPNEALSFFSWLCTKRMFNPQNFLLETNTSKAIAAASRVSKMLDVYQTELCRNVTKTMITLLSNPAMEKEKSTIISNLYYLYDRLSVEHVADAYENYIKPAVLQNDKPDWFTKLAHTNEDTWSKIKTIIQGTGKPVVSVKKSKQTKKK